MSHGILLAESKCPSNVLLHLLADMLSPRLLCSKCQQRRRALQRVGVAIYRSSCDRRSPVSLGQIDQTDDMAASHSDEQHEL